MKKIGDVTSTADKNGEFTDGNVAAGTPPTQLMGDWFNSVQREIINVLIKAGVAQSKTKDDQLAEAISKLIGSAGYQPDGYSYSKVESNLKFQPIGSYVTPPELKSGLDEKLNVQQPTAIGSLKITSSTDYATLSLIKKSGERVNIETMQENSESSVNIIYRDASGKNIAVTTIPRKNGRVLLNGEHGIGASELVQYSENGSSISNPVGFYGISGGDPNAVPGGGGSNIVQIGAGKYFWQLGKSNLSNAIYVRPVSNGILSDWLSIWSESNATPDRNGCLRIGGNDLSDYPVGSPIPWTQLTAPTGYLICNGQSFNKASYPLLAKAYPDGKLPEMRGEFIRGLDAGRGVDSGRTALSSQGDAMRLLSGSARLQGTEAISQETGVFKNAGSFKNVNSGHGTGNSTSKILGFDTSDVTPTANENRPRNIAFLYIVRAA
ncbi:tail fiber protein [Providencia rettgeri]